VWREPFRHPFANAVNAGQRLHGTERTAPFAALDDSRREGGTDPWEFLEGRGTGGVEIDRWTRRGITRRL
jgi:hypothetical protein